MIKRLLILIALLVAGAQGPSKAADGAPNFIEYQGSVLDSTGSPLAPTVPRLYKMEFRLWSALEGGSLVWAEQQFVNVFNGRFAVRLGEGQPLDDGVAPEVPHGRLDLAFASQDRFLGLTVINPPAVKSEISPRLAFFSAPYAMVANEATNLVQMPGSFSTLVAGSIAYSTQEISSQATVNLALDKRTNLISAAGTGTVATLPTDGGLTELLVVKTDSTPQFVTVVAPGNGSINGGASSVRLKVRGESVTLQNVGGNDWWIVKDSRDRTQVGSIIAYGGATPPPGYLPCDGSSHARNVYPDLFAVVGTTWGSSAAAALPAIPPATPSAADNARFNVPNLNGRYLRGINPGGGGEDEDAGARFAMFADGGTVVGSYQQDAIRRHFHLVNDPGHLHPGSSVAGAGKSVKTVWGVTPEADKTTTAFAVDLVTGSQSFTMAVTASIAVANTGITGTGPVTDGGSGLRTGTETRPDSAVVRYCIKY